MREEKIEITILADGKLSAATDGLKGKECDAELSALLSDIAFVYEVEHTAEAREQPPAQRQIKRNEIRRGES